MAVINNPEMEKYKTYYTERVKGKDGITRPITKVKYIKQCPECGDSMEISKRVVGKAFKPRFIRWECTSKFCNHTESEETIKEKAIRQKPVDYKEVMGIKKI